MTMALCGAYAAFRSVSQQQAGGRLRREQDPHSEEQSGPPTPTATATHCCTTSSSSSSPCVRAHRRARAALPHQDELLRDRDPEQARLGVAQSCSSRNVPSTASCRRAPPLALPFPVSLQQVDLQNHVGGRAAGRAPWLDAPSFICRRRKRTHVTGTGRTGGTRRKHNDLDSAKHEHVLERKQPHHHQAPESRRSSFQKASPRPRSRRHALSLFSSAVFYFFEHLLLVEVKPPGAQLFAAAEEPVVPEEGPLLQHDEKNVEVEPPAEPISAPSGPRILMIPDIHGDYEVMRMAVQLVWPIQSTDQLIFTGDFVDRGPQPRECYALAQELSESFNVTRLTGNHEWVTLMGVHEHAAFAQYVPAEDLKSFGGWPERMHEFSENGDLGKQIRENFDVIKLLSIPSDPLTRTLFVHAGIRDKTLKKYGSVEAVRQEGKKSLQSNKLDTILLNEILQTRHLAQGDEKSVCREVLRILKLAGAERLVVGHTPTPLLPGGSAGVPMSRCEGRFILMDVAMSRWMGGGQPAALLIETDADTGKMTRIYAKLPMHEGAAGKEMDFHIGPPLSAEKAAARDEL